MKCESKFWTPRHAPADVGDIFGCASHNSATPGLWGKLNQSRAEDQRTVRFAFLPSLVGALALGLLCLAGSARASTNLLTSANIMVLQYYPTWIDTNDNINVRGTAGDTRYGVFEFDLGAVTPFTLTSASLELTCVYRAVTVASSLQESYLIDTTGKTPVNGMNWSNYLSDYVGQEYYTNETLGVISAPGVAVDIGQSSTTVASAADLTQVQTVLNSGGKLTIVLKPGNTGSELNWGQNTNLWPASTLGPSAALTLVGFSTTTVLASSANPSLPNHKVTFTATVQTNGTMAGNATGTVVFLNSGTPLSTNNVSGGAAYCSTRVLPSGTNLIGARYVGDAYYLGSTSLPLAQLELTANPAGVVAHYTFDNTLADSGPYGLDLTTGPGGVNYAAAGKFGQALHCVNPGGGAGTGNYHYNASSVFDFGVGDFAVAFWYQSDHTTGQTPINVGEMVTKDDHSTGNPGWGVNLDGTSSNPPVIAYIIEPVGANNTVEFDANAPTDDNTAWHHIVLQRTGDIMECWLDGTLVSTENGMGNVDVSTPGYAFAVGARGVLSSGALASGGGYGLNGRIDELWVFNRSLTPDRIVELRDNNVAPAPATSSPAAEVGLRFAAAHDAGTGSLVFTWHSQAGMRYNLLSDNSLSHSPATWQAHHDSVFGLCEDISADPSGTNTLRVALPSAAARFFALQELDPFSMDGSNIITALTDRGIVNGKLAIGTPGNQAASISGLWAPPFVSSDFGLSLAVFGQTVPTPVWKWWPHKIEQQGAVNGLTVSAATVLAPGKRGGLVSITLRNTTSNAFSAPLVFTTRGTLDSSGSWEFGQPTSSTATKATATNGTLTLTAGGQSIVLQDARDALTWDTGRGVGTQTLALQPGGTATVHLAFALGPTAEAAAACDAMVAAPPQTIADADAAYRQMVTNLFQRLPILECTNRDVERFYTRSLVHLIMHRWDAPDFALRPYYSTGSTRGGCVGNYLWNYGESWEMLPLYDPAAHREHIKQFLKCDLTKYFAFNPVNGKAFGVWYMVNQEKIIGLVYHYVRLTGDTAFLAEVVNGKTVLQHVLDNAVFMDNLSQPVALIDYGPLNSHLELRGSYTYNHVMPDLNGRRYASYLFAARLAEIAGNPAPWLLDRAAALKPLLKQALWNPQTRWFDFIDGNGQPETRWTVQMFYLFGSGVLDTEEEAGLISHLNDNEFLGGYGLYSLALNDPAYDPTDVDNGGPGSCTSFPPNIANLLCQGGWPSEAEDIMRRCIWWGSSMPYWGDSIYADRMDYRHDTPLQCTIDGVAVAQFFIFGMFGVNPQFDGTILVSPRPATFVPHAALRGVRIRDSVFDIELGDNEFKVVSGGKTVVAPLGHTISLKNNVMSISD